MYEYFVKLVVPKGANKVFIHAKLENCFDSTDELKKLLNRNTIYYVWVYLNDFPSYDHVENVVEVEGISNLIDAVRKANIEIKSSIDGRNRYLTLPEEYEVVRVEFNRSTLYGDKTFIEVQKTSDPYAGVNMSKIALDLRATICKGNVVSLGG